MSTGAVSTAAGFLKSVWARTKETI